MYLYILTIHLKVYGHTSCLFSVIFTKCINFCDFLFAFMEDRMGLLIKEKNCSKRANSFLSKLTHIEKGGKNENSKVASPESYPVILKSKYL